MAKSKEDELQVDEVLDEDEFLVPYDIAAYPSDLTLSVIYEMWSNGDIEIPEFQRNFVWSIKQSSLLIESFLLGLPVPQVFFYVDEKNKSLVIDGQQRIMSVVYFFDGYFGSESLHGKRNVFRLSGLDPRSKYAGKKFEELDEATQRKLKSAVLRAINIRQLNPKGENTSIYHIFERLNTGGTPLTPQEIRNCVFRGGLVRQLRELNNDKNWRDILGKKTFDIHQKDIELILRLFALSGGAWKTYEKPMKEYLNRTMQAHQDGESKRVNQFIDRFPKAAKTIVEKLGKRPFHVRGPLNSSALDSVFCTIIDHLQHIPEDVSERYEVLKADKTFEGATYYGTSDVSVLIQRFRLAEQYLIS